MLLQRQDQEDTDRQQTPQHQIADENPRLSLGRKLFLAVLLLCIAVFVAEAMAQVICILLIPPMPKLSQSRVLRDEQLGWVFRPHLVQKHRYFELRFNSLGLRGQEPGSRPVELMILGDSVVMGTAVPEDKTFAALIGAVNAGFNGYSTMQERDRYKRDLFQLSPQKLILVVQANDIMSEQGNRDMIRETLDLNLDLRNKSFLEYEGLYRIYLWRKGAFQFGEVQDEAAKERAYLEAVSEPHPQSTLEEWRRAVLDIKETAQNSRFYVVLAPPRIQVRRYQAGSTVFWLNTMLAEFCRNQDIPFLDLLPALAKHDAGGIFDDTAHFNLKGHSVVAQEIADFLKR